MFPSRLAVIIIRQSIPETRQTVRMHMSESDWHGALFKGF